MAANGIRGAKRRGKPWRTTTPDPEARRRPDLVQRDFTASRPNELWVADFSYLRCWEGVVFFSFVIDVFSRKAVGWQFASHMRTTLVLDALRMALSTRERVQEVRLIHHSDRGSQYLSGDCTQTLTDHDVLASVGSTGDAYDNSMAESFVDSFKTELIAERVWRTRSQLELAVVEYISWFNDSRLHENLGDRAARDRGTQTVRPRRISPGVGRSRAGPMRTGPVSRKRLEEDHVERNDEVDRYGHSWCDKPDEDRDQVPAEHGKQFEWFVLLRLARFRGRGEALALGISIQCEAENPDRKQRQPVHRHKDALVRVGVQGVRD